MIFYVQSKTSIALVCDEKEIGKVDPMNFDSSFYVSTKCTPDPWTTWLSWRAWLAWLVLLCFSLPATCEVLAREASVPILNHTENVFRILAARKLEREQKKSKVDEERGYWVSKGEILLLPKRPLLRRSFFFLSLQFWVCPDAENFPYTMPYGKTCYAS